MKRIVLALMFVCTPALAEVDLTANYDYYLQPNKGNNYDNGMGYTAGIRHDIYKHLRGEVDFVHITDVDFPSISDPKGSWGELRGYGAMYSLIMNFFYNENVSFNITGGAGPVIWQFRRNPYLQDANATVEIDPSIIYKAGIGMDIKIYDNWSVNLGIGWLDTKTGKRVIGSTGEHMNLLDSDDNLNLRYKTFKIGVKREF